MLRIKRLLSELTKKDHEVVAWQCGHKTTIKALREFYDNGFLEPNSDLLHYGYVDYCLKCLKKKAIRCAKCGKVINVGDPVSYFTPDKDFVVPPYATILMNNPLTLIACVENNTNEWPSASEGYFLPEEVFSSYMKSIEGLFTCPYPLGRIAIPPDNPSRTKITVIG